jgi:hypothetical protein
METNAKKLGIVLFTMATVFFGCKKDDVAPLNNGGMFTEKSMKETNVASWKVASFMKTTEETGAKGEEMAGKFKGWAFKFYKDGSVDAFLGDKVVTGKYSKAVGEGKDGMMIDFGAQTPFSELNNSYVLTSESRTTIMLEDKEVSDGAVSKLIFEKLGTNVAEIEVLEEVDIK